MSKNQILLGISMKFVNPNLKKYVKHYPNSQIYCITLSKNIFEVIKKIKQQYNFFKSKLIYLIIDKYIEKLENREFDISNLFMNVSEFVRHAFFDLMMYNEINETNSILQELYRSIKRPKRKYNSNQKEVIKICSKTHTILREA